MTCNSFEFLKSLNTINVGAHEETITVILFADETGMMGFGHLKVLPFFLGETKYYFDVIH